MVEYVLNAVFLTLLVGLMVLLSMIYRWASKVLPSHARSQARWAAFMIFFVGVGLVVFFISSFVLLI